MIARKLMIGIILLLAGCLVTGTSAMAATRTEQPASAEELQTAQHGADLLMNGDIPAAVGVFHQIQASDPDSALGYVLEADAVWWKIYLTTGNLVDPDVFDVVSAESTPYDSHFDDLVHISIARAEANIHAHQDVARNYLFEGLAYALRARLLGLRGKDMPTARAGKKMRSLLLSALEKDPSLADAYLGVGIYNYFVDTLPGIVKLIRWLIGLPAGNRAEGLRQLEDAAAHGQLTSGEALFYLGKDYSRANERQYEKSLQAFQELSARYPRNGLWKLLGGSLEIRMGHRQQGEEAYRAVFTETSGETSAAGKALHQAARQALQRMNPGEKLND